MKYNPTHHANVVSNLKRGYEERYKAVLTLPDTVIWKIFDEWQLVESEDPDDREEPIYSALQEEQTGGNSAVATD